MCIIDKMWRHRPSLLIGITVSLMTLGCAGEIDKQSSEQGEVSEFTTKGKPTKIIETPWGPREVYDPLQDPQINQIFQRWYAQNKYNYAEYETIDPQGYALLNHAGHIHEVDYLKLKCEMRERQFTFATSLFYLKKYTGDCPLEFGKKTISQCVQDNIEDRAPGRATAFIRRDIKYSPDWGLPDPKDRKAVGALKNEFVFGPQSYTNVNEQMEIFFKFNCRKWVGIAHVFPGYENYFVSNPKDSGNLYKLFVPLEDREPSLEEFCEASMNKETAFCQVP